MYMAKKIRMQHLHIHEHLFRKNIESFKKKIDPKVYLTYTYLIVRIKFTFCEYNMQQ